MANEMRTSDMLSQISPSLQRLASDTGSIVLMTCGIAGSGKTTLAKEVTQTYPSFTRLSMDEIIFAKYGIYGKDYDADEVLYESYLDEIEIEYQKRLQTLLQAKKDIVLEKSLYAKEQREEFKKKIEEASGRWLLIYLKAMDKEVLWRRICDRSNGEKDANSALTITRDRFERYWNGFEEPQGEGEIVIEVATKDSN